MLAQNLAIVLHSLDDRARAVESNPTSPGGKGYTGLEAMLQYVFNRSEAESFMIMLKVHNEGLGVAGTYPYEIATTKADKAMNLAKAREFPLLCTVEEE